jgi:hypothetical protein
VPLDFLFHPGLGNIPRPSGVKWSLLMIPLSSTSINLVKRILRTTNALFLHGNRTRSGSRYMFPHCWYGVSIEMEIRICWNVIGSLLHCSEIDRLKYVLIDKAYEQAQEISFPIKVPSVTTKNAVYQAAVPGTHLCSKNWFGLQHLRKHARKITSIPWFYKGILCCCTCMQLYIPWMR